MVDIEFVERRSKDKKHIIVLGAGMAGLTAAYQLVKAGHDVTVLEARDRVGGKVYTMRHPEYDIEPTLLGEAGATVLVPEMPIPFVYACHFKVEHAAVPVRGAELHLRDHRLGDGNVAGRWPPLPVRNDERRLGATKMWRKYFGAFTTTLGNPRDEKWLKKRKIAPLDRVTLTQFLRDRGASAGAVEILRLRRHDLLGDGFDSGSALQWLREPALFPPQPGALRFFPGGFDQLPKAMAKKLGTLGARVLTSNPVVEIEEKGAGIAAICSTEGGTKRERFEGDEMICAIPFSVLRTLKLPEMPREKRRAIDLQHHTSFFRAHLQTSAPAWTLADITFTDRMPMLVAAADPRYPNPNKKGLIEVYVGGRYARALQALGEQERIERLLNEIEALSPGFRAAYEDKYAAHCWDEDPWSRGAYPWYAPGELASIAAHAAAPVGRLHFAGEHTSLVPGWIQGAIESGERAAAEVA